MQHPNVLGYLDFRLPAAGQDGEGDRVIQAAPPGPTLAERIAGGWRATEAEAHSIASQVLDALLYLHHLVPPVSSGGVTPDNVILTDGGAVFLAPVGHFGTRPHAVPGDVGDGATVATAQADLVGLGATLVQSLAGELVDDAQTMTILAELREDDGLSEPLAIFLTALLAASEAGAQLSTIAAMQQLRAVPLPATSTVVRPEPAQWTAPRVKRVAPARVRDVALPFHSSHAKMAREGDAVIFQAKDAPRRSDASLGFAVFFLGVTLWTFTVFLRLDANPLFILVFSVFLLTGVSMLVAGLLALTISTKVRLSPAGVRVARSRAGLTYRARRWPLAEVEGFGLSEEGCVALRLPGKDLRLGDGADGEEAKDLVYLLTQALDQLREVPADHLGQEA